MAEPSGEICETAGARKSRFTTRSELITRIVQRCNVETHVCSDKHVVARWNRAYNNREKRVRPRGRVVRAIIIVLRTRDLEIRRYTCARRVRFVRCTPYYKTYNNNDDYTVFALRTVRTHNWKYPNRTRTRNQGNNNEKSKTFA